MFRIGLYSRASLIRNTGRLGQQQQRNFQKIVIKNKTGIRLLDLSKVALKGIGIFYASALVIGTLGYFAGSYYLEPYQHVSKDWSLLPTIHSRFAVYQQEVAHDQVQSNHLLIKTLRTIAEEEGVRLEGDDATNEAKFKLLNLEQLQNKSKEWQTTYVDIVIRLAIAKVEIGDVENSKKLVSYAINVPMNIGSKNLKSQVLRLASKFSANSGELDKAESYLLDGIRYNEFYGTDIQFRDHGSYLLTNDSSLNSELFNSLLDLGVLFARKEDYTKALEIFLNLLQIIDDSNYDFIKTNEKPMLKNYVGEILYKKGLLTRSIEWCNEAFKEAYPNSRNDPKSAHITRQILNNLIVLYELNGDNDLKIQAEEKLGEIDVNFTKGTGLSLFYSLFS